MQGARKFSSTLLFPVLTIGILLLAWWVVTTYSLVNPLFMPRLSPLGTALGNALGARSTYADIFFTAYRAFVGVIASIIVGVPLGLIFGRFPVLYRFFELPIDFFRSVPSSALFFLFILVFGIGDASKIAVVFYGCSLILIINTIYGVRPTREKRDRINMLIAFRATRWQVFRYAVFPDALPSIAAGIRVCISLSLVLVVVTEMFLGSSTGLGRTIYDYYLAYRVPEMYAVIILAGLLGFVANKGFLFLERRMSFWLPEWR